MGHTIISSTVTPAHDDRQLRHVRARNCADHLRAIFRDPSLLCLGANHVPRDVDEEKERDLALRTELDEVRCLQCRLGEENAVVAHDAHRIAVNVSESLQQGQATVSGKSLG